MAWVLTTGLKTWRDEINAVFPDRDKTTDGAVGNLAHQGSSSGHNPDKTGNAEYKDGDSRDEVRAVDIDRDLVPGSDVNWMERVVQFVVEKARRGEYVPFRYIIYNRRIWHRTYGWTTRTYTGANAHDHHAHFSGDWTNKADEWTGSLGLASIRGAAGGGWDSMLVKKGDSGQEVTYSQYLLAELGYPVGDIDGVYGPKMESAVNAYRKAHGNPGTTDATMITGWMLFHMQRAVAQKFAGRDGRDGAPGPQGPAGKDGSAIGGNLTVTGGTLRVVAAP